MSSTSGTILRPARYRLLGHPTDLAGHLSTLGPSRFPRDPAAGVKPSCSMLEAPVWRAAAAPGSRPLKLAVAHAAGRGGTIVVNGMEGAARVTRTSCSS